MFKKEEQRSWTSRQVHGVGKQCYHAEQWRGSVTDLTQLDRPNVNEEQLQAVTVLMDGDRRQTIRELGHEIGLSPHHTFVLHILKNRLLNSKDEGTTSWHSIPGCSRDYASNRLLYQHHLQTRRC
ncbi:hypothetical protein Trydic_g18939 [Trypoxylus dichotomus]